jgi:hypothetical protein
MPGLSLSPSEPASKIAERPRCAPRAYGLWALAAVTAITAARLVWLVVQPADLYPDEAQYWFWSLHPALGYYSKPPLVAWLIALTTNALGDSEFAIRLSAPLLHAIAAGFVYGIAARLWRPLHRFLVRIAHHSARRLAFGLSDLDRRRAAVLGGGTYAFIRAREPGGERCRCGRDCKLGLLAKYAMA